MKNNYRYKKENYDFWVSRLKKRKNLVCTNDILLDKIEENQIINRIKNNKIILEIGCGNGLILKRLVKEIKIKKYHGFDFVKELVNVCIKKYRSKKINFQTLDMTLIDRKTFKIKYDYIISKRALQNVLSTKLQLKTIDNVGYFLRKNGKMILVESSINAQNNINKIRKKFNLSKIIPPFHNLFFNDDKVKEYNFKNLKLIKIDNFSSSFYFTSRIIYALYAKIFLKKNPSYDHPLNIIASMLDGKLIKEDFSQIKTYIFKKK